MNVEEMLESGRLQAVEADNVAAASALDEARRHLESARAIVDRDPNGAYQLAYDGARKAVMAHLRVSGLRVRRGEGAHAVTAEYAAVAIAADLGARLDSMRRRRNRSEYGSMFFDAREVEDTIDVGRAIVEAVEKAI